MIVGIISISTFLSIIITEPTIVCTNPRVAWRVFQIRIWLFWEQNNMLCLPIFNLQAMVNFCLEVGGIVIDLWITIYKDLFGTYCNPTSQFGKVKFTLICTCMIISEYWWNRKLTWKTKLTLLCKCTIIQEPNIVFSNFRKRIAWEVFQIRTWLFKKSKMTGEFMCWSERKSISVVNTNTRRIHWQHIFKLQANILNKINFVM